MQYGVLVKRETSNYGEYRLIYIELRRKICDIPMNIRISLIESSARRRRPSFRWSDSADNPPLVERSRRTMMDAR